MPTFSIVVPTYNRHALLRLALESVRRQSFHDFEVVVLDDGSAPPAISIIQGMNDARFSCIRFDENRHPADILEASLKTLRGDIFLCVEDDNGLVPGALAAVREVFQSRAGAQFVATNFLHFNHGNGHWRQLGGTGCSGRLMELEAQDVLWRFCSVWGIGPASDSPPPAHFSAWYISMALLREGQRRFGRVFDKPLGDSALLKLFGIANKYYYLDLPLSYIGEHEGQISNAGKKGQRKRLGSSIWLRDFSVRHTGLQKGLSYDNLAADCHLEILERLGLRHDPKARLRPEFYRRHFASVCSDSPWTQETLRDILEVLPHLLTAENMLDLSLIGLRRLQRLIRHPKQVFLNRFQPTTTREAENQDRQFNDCLEFGAWAAGRYVNGAGDASPTKPSRLI